MKRLLSTALLASSLLLSAVGLHAEAVAGEPAPDFTLKDMNGETHSLSDYRGKVVVLEWFNHGCPFVQKFYHSGKMQEWQEEQTGEGVVWLVIDSTNPKHQDNLSADEAKKLYGEWHMAATSFLLDPEGQVGHMYSATNTPDMFVIDPEGRLIYRGAIDDKRSTDMNDIPGAHNYVLAALKAQEEGKQPNPHTTKPYGCSVKYAH